MESAHREAGLSPGRAVSAGKLFFPLAAAYAAAILPASVLPMLGVAPALPGLASPAAHAHEMLFGFALLVVAGHQLGQLGSKALGLLLALWVLARLSFLFAPQGIVAVAANVAFALVLGERLAPRLFTSARKLRNLALPVALTALAAGATTVELARRFEAPLVERTALGVVVVVFSLLMLFMGGRLVAPAAAGQLYRQGGNLGARVQPRIEAALVVLMLVAAGAAAFPSHRGATVGAGIAMCAAGALAAARLVRWRLWALRARPDLLCIGAGYAWVAVGLFAWGAATLLERRELAMLHAITVGGIGTLTINVMALTWARQARVDPAPARLALWSTLLVAVATLARIAADFGAAHRPACLLLAACAWSAAFALLLVRFARVRPRQRPAP